MGFNLRSVVLAGAFAMGIVGCDRNFHIPEVRFFAEEDKSITAFRYRVVYPQDWIHLDVESAEGNLETYNFIVDPPKRLFTQYCLELFNCVGGNEASQEVVRDARHYLDLAERAFEEP